jgi:phosphatidylglycerophosphate synthase
MANAITAARLILVLPFAFWMARGDARHAADCVFVTGGLAAAATRGAVPWMLPFLVAAALAQHVIDSYWIHRNGALRGSRLGRWNGILYFVPLGGDVLVRLGLRPLAPLVTAIAWGLVATSVLSMGARLLASRSLE